MRTLRFIWRHPIGGSKGLVRFATWQIRTRVLGKPSMVVDWVDGTKLTIERGLTGATGNYYCGLHEYSDMAFLLDLLLPGDLFVDVGANVGTYTVLASGACGAMTLALEPVQSSFERLEAHVDLNGIGNLVDLRRVGASDRVGTLEFISDSDTTNHVMHAGDGSPGSTEGRSTSIPVTTLDTLLSTRTPTALKIDVEGWEMPVLDGARDTLCAFSLLACIIEANSSSRPYGHTPGEVHRMMKAHGFTAVRYNVQSRQIEPGVDPTSNNLLFIRRLDEVLTRLGNAPDRTVLGGARPGT